jgi:FlaA1/EpsC-like NDP-sugar epimerase/tetratricopeptide (TPR) repeat protein
MQPQDPPNDIKDAVAKAKDAFAMTPEDRWRRELESRDPKQVTGAALALGRLAAAQGELNEAVKLLSEAASSTVPTVTPRALVQLVPVLERLGRQAEADHALHEAQAHSDPEQTPDVILDVSAILVRRGQEDRAIRVLEAVVDAWSRNQRAIDDGAGLSRAVAALRLGNLLATRSGASHAIPCWELAMSANFPAVTPEAALRLADAFMAPNRSGDRKPAEIEELYRIAIDFDDPTSSPEAALRLADFYMKEEQPQLAAKEYESLLPIGGEVAERAEAGLTKARAKIGAEPAAVVWRLLVQARRSTEKAIGNKGKGVSPIARGRTGKRTLIVGAGTGGTYLLRDLDRDRYEVAGWIDDRQRKGTELGGLPVLGTIDDLEQILASGKIKAVLIAIPTMAGARRRTAVEAALRAGGEIEVKNLPSMFELRRDRNIAAQLRDVRVEETMDKQPMRIDRDAGALVRGRSVMITGAGSAIGGELCRQVAHARARYVSLVDASSMALRRVLGDLERDRGFDHGFPVLAACDRVKTMRWALEAHRPEVVFHVAGHSYAPIVEENPLEAMRTDVLGTWDFARLCGEANVKRFVLVSGEDAAESRGVFSASKALAERSLSVVENEFSDTDFVAVRVGHVYRSAGSVIEVFEHQIETGGPVTLTSADAKRRFMRVELATQLLLRTAWMARPGGLYALSSEEELLIGNLAEWMIRLQGKEVNEIGIKVTRPRRIEKSLDNPYNARERPVPTDIPEVLEIEQPELEIEQIRGALESVREPIEEGNSAKLLGLVGGPIRSLLDTEPKDTGNEGLMQPATG